MPVHATVAYNDHGQALLPVRIMRLGTTTSVARYRWGWWHIGRVVSPPSTAYPLQASPAMRQLSTQGLWGAKD